MDKQFPWMGASAETLRWGHPGESIRSKPSSGAAVVNGVDNAEYVILVSTTDASTVQYGCVF
jgi:hypothetical protein